MIQSAPLARGATLLGHDIAKTGSHAPVLPAQSFDEGEVTGVEGGEDQILLCGDGSNQEVEVRQGPAELMLACFHGCEARPCLRIGADDLQVRLYYSVVKLPMACGGEFVKSPFDFRRADGGCGTSGIAECLPAPQG